MNIVYKQCVAYIIYVFCKDYVNWPVGKLYNIQCIMFVRNHDITDKKLNSFMNLMNYTKKQTVHNI